MLSLGKDQPVFDWFFTSSNGVIWHFSDAAQNAEEERYENTAFGMTSMPMSPEAKQAYLARTGHAIIEFPIARSAIEVLVHGNNPLDSISPDELKSAFGAQGMATTWKDLGVAGGPLSDLEVKPIGGNPSWGTGRMFQEIVLGGAAWRPDVDASHDVVYAHGVEAAVSQLPGGIGYAVQGPRKHRVKVLALASSDGNGYTLATEDAIYSGRYPLQRKLYAVVAAPSLDQAPPSVREMVNLLLSDQGQTLMVRTRSLPLAAAEVVEWRKRLGLAE
jgi:phosphate transport system substrate-binding protein